MRSLIALLLALWLAPAWAQVPMTGAGKGTPAAAASYQGPGDVVASASAWGSCARVYTAAQASTSTSLCDLVAVTGGAAVCTLRGSSSGFVDLAASYCAGTTPSAACAAASGGSCKVTKIYDQTGNGNHWTQVTLATMPALTFNALNSLPGWTCTSAASTQIALAAFTLAQPFSIAAVAIRTSNFNTQMGLLSQNGAFLGLYFSTANNGVQTLPGTTAISITSATDNAWHAIQGVVDNTSSIVAADGTASSAGGSGTTGFTGGVMRLCRGSTSLDGSMMEAGIWSGAWNSTQYGAINTNAHSVTSGYNF